MDTLLDFIRDNGGYAGAASVLGLAILSLLYFAQAREVKRLREWAGRAPERAVELEQRVTSDATRRVAPQPVVRTPPPPRPGQPQTAAGQAGVRPAAANGAPGAVPGAAPAGAAAAGAAAAAAKPATAAATGATAPGQAAPAAAAAAAAVPGTAAAPAAGIAPGAPGAAPASASPPAPAPAPGTSGTPAVPAAGGAASAAASASAPAAPPAPPGDSPTTVTPPASPSAGATPAPPPAGGIGAPPPPRTAAGRPRTAAAGAPRPAAAAPLRSSAPSTAVPPGARGGSSGGGRSPRLAIGLALGALAVVVVGLVVLLGGGDDTPGGNASSTTDAPPRVAPAPGDGTQTTATEPASRGETTVAVLNGTTTPGLAARVADEIEASGFKRGPTANATEQNRSATLVQYVEGAREEARTVARVIGIGADAISPLDQGTRTVAGDAARVVVTVGADQNQAQQG